MTFQCVLCFCINWHKYQVTFGNIEYLFCVSISRARVHKQESFKQKQRTNTHLPTSMSKERHVFYSQLFSYEFIFFCRRLPCILYRGAHYNTEGALLFQGASEKMEMS